MKNVIYQRIIEAQQAKDWEAVIMLCDELRETDPTDILGYIEGALALRYIEHSEDSDALIKHAIEQFGIQAQLLVILVDTSIDNHKWTTALEYCARLRKEFPEDIRGYMRAAKVYQHLEQKDEVKKILALLFQRIETEQQNSSIGFDKMKLPWVTSQFSIDNYQVLKKSALFWEQLIQPNNMAEYFRDLSREIERKTPIQDFFTTSIMATTGLVLENRSDFELILKDDYVDFEESIILRQCSNFTIRMTAEYLELANHTQLHSLLLTECENFVIKDLHWAKARNPIAISQCKNFIVENLYSNYNRGCGIIIFNSRFFIIQDCAFDSNLSSGINIVGLCSDGVIKRNIAKNGTGYFNKDAGINLCAVSSVIDIDDIPDNNHELLSILEKTYLPIRIEITDCITINNRAQGLYLEGASNCYIHSNQVNNNNKEGLCLDWGCFSNVLSNNSFSGNGYRANVGEFEENIDFIKGTPKMPDGSSFIKLPAISLDNSAFNIIKDNNIFLNYGGGIKCVRTAICNRFDFNHIIDNAVSGQSLGNYYFQGIALLGLGNEGGEFSEEIDVKLNFSNSEFNIIVKNYISGHASEIYCQNGSEINFFNCNTIGKSMGFEKEIIEIKNRLSIAERDARDALTMTLLRDSASKVPKKNQVAFIGTGNIFENAVYVSIAFDKLIRNNQTLHDMDYIYVCRNKAEFDFLSNSNIKCELWMHQQWLSRYLLECKWVVLSSHVVARPGDCLLNASISGSKKLQLWHGYPAKRIAYDLIPSDSDIHSISELMEDCISIDAVITPTFHEESQQIYKKSFPSAKLFVTGDPRTDSLFSNCEFYNLNKDLDQWLEKNKDRKKIIFMPTFRDEVEQQLKLNEQMISFLKKFVDSNINASLALKLHPAVKNHLKLSNNMFNSEKIIIMDANDTDIYKLLPAFDAILTDYSSVRFDFLATENPILLWRPDFLKRANLEGIYEKIDSVSYEINDMSFEKIYAFLEDDPFRSERVTLADEVHAFRDGKSSIRVANLISNLLLD